jgi:hypothetical protein
LRVSHAAWIPFLRVPLACGVSFVLMAVTKKTFY